MSADGLLATTSESGASAPTKHEIIILRGPPEHAAWAFNVLAEHAHEIRKCQIGYGWGVGNRRLGLSGFMRRTKAGLSINYYRRDGVEQRGSTSTTEPDAVPGMTK